MLRTYRADRQVEVTALVDASASMGLPERDDKLGLALAIGASLAYIGMADNDAVRIGAFAIHRGSMKLEATQFHRRRESYLNFKEFVTSVKAGGETVSVRPSINCCCNAGRLGRWSSFRIFW